MNDPGRVENQDWNLKELSNPKMYCDPLNIRGVEPKHLYRHLELMYRIRFAERQLALGKKEGLIGGPVHLGVGQEAIAAGVSAVLTKNDRVFGGHRSHSHVISQGASLEALFAEIMGKESGLSKGMGGSMHLYDEKNGFYGSVPIVAGTVSLAVGAGLGAKLTNSKDIGVAYFGDGAIEEGTVHESLNLASQMRIPVLFVVENNLFASHMHISQRQPKYSTARFAAANDIPFKVVDGNDVLAVEEASKNLVENSRQDNIPGFIELVTYRWYGHVDWREDVDVGVNRSKDDLMNWKKRDPISRLELGMKSAGVCDEADLESVRQKVKGEVENAWSKALLEEYPAKSALLDRVYANLQRGQ